MCCASMLSPKIVQVRFVPWPICGDFKPQPIALHVLPRQRWTFPDLDDKELPEMVVFPSIGSTVSCEPTLATFLCLAYDEFTPSLSPM